MRALIVGDDHPTSTGFAAALSASGWAARCVAPGTDALAALDADRPRIVVLLTGIEVGTSVNVCAELRGRAPAGVVRILARLSGSEQAAALLEAGADDCFVGGADALFTRLAVACTRRAAPPMDAVGLAFFSALARHLAGSLGVRNVLVLEREPHRARPTGSVIAAWPEGRPPAGTELSLAGSPFADPDAGLVLRESATRGPSPDAPLLARFDADGLVGCSLRDPEGRPVGALVAMDAAPLRAPAEAVAALEVWATRAGAELAQLQACRRLRRDEAAFRALVAHARDLTIVFGRDGHMLYANDAARTTLGAAPETLIGRSGCDWLHSEDHAAAADALRRLLERPGESVRGEYRVRHADGAWIQIEARVSNWLHDRAVHGLVMHGRDLRERDALHEQLLRADRMASVGTLAAAVAHEINNPLAYVIGNLAYLDEELIAGRRAMDDELSLTLREARDGAERVRRIVGDLKTFSRADDVHEEALDVREVMDATLTMAANEIRPRARVVRVYGDPPSTYANEGRLAQVFLNLVVNAAQAIPEGRAAENEIRVTVDTCGEGTVRVQVSDTGPGIAPDHIPRLFDPFFTTKPVGIGTGLGLAICRELVESQGGTIDVESTPGRGTTFTVRLPATSALAGPKTPVPAEADDDTLPRLEVLVVDDEPRVAQALRRMLRRHRVTLALTGQEAQGCLEEHDYDLVLCDLMMPGVTGMDLFVWVCAERPALRQRFVFMSGGAFTPRARVFLDSVANPRLEKPFGRDELQEVVRRISRRVPARVL